MERRKSTAWARWLGAGALILAGLFVYWPALTGEWLWDDHLEILRNPTLARLDGWWRIWLRPEGPDYYPLKTMLQWCEWQLWGNRILPYHLVSLCLHIFGAFLLWRVLERLRVPGAYLAGLLFAIHPLCVESVAWISELKNVMSLPLLLLAMLYYKDLRPPVLKSAADFKTGGLRSLLFFALSLLCKTSGVMFPVVILLYAWWRRGRIGWADVRASLPFFAISLVLGAVTAWFQRTRAIAGMDLHLGGPLWRLGRAALAVAFYLCKCLLPLRLAPIYPLWAAGSLLQAGICLLLLFAVGAFLWRGRAGGRGACFGAGFFLASLLPVLGFIPMSYLRLSAVADHLCYLPLVGIVALAAAAARRLPVAILAVLCALLALLGRGQAAIYRSPATFWGSAVERNPEAWLAQNSLGTDLTSRGRPEEAVAHFQAALRSKPDYAEAENNWGDALLRLNRLPEAAAHFQRAIRLKPDYAEAYCNWGSTLVQEDRFDEAVGLFEKAMRLKPGYAEAYSNRGLVYSSEGRQAAAIADFEAALRFDPGLAEAELDLGLAWARSGRRPEAIAHYRQALRLRPGFREAHNNLGNALFLSGRVAEAAAEYEEALRIDPHYVDAKKNLAIARRSIAASHDRP